MERLSKSQFNFIGGAYEARSKTQDAARTVNMYPELHSLGAGKHQEPAALYSTSGLRRVQSVGLGPIRCAYTLSNSQLSYIVSGNEIYQLNSANGIPVLVSGNLNTSLGPVAMSDNGRHIIIVDGTNGYTIEIGVAPVITVIADPNFYNGAKSVAYQGGYFILEKAGTSNFFISDLDSIDFPPLNESSVLSSPDILVNCISNNEQLYLMGARTIEVWALTGVSASNPFSLIQGRVMPMGVTAQATVKKLGNTFFWLGANDQGDGVVFSMENDIPTRVSTHAIEWRIQQLGDLSTATAYAYQENGHYFYALNLPGSSTTWVYDMTTKHWHERQSRISGNTSRTLAEVHCFLNGQHIIGDYRNGNLYVYDQDYYYDDIYPIMRLRQTPHSNEGVAMVFYKTLQVDIQPGVGTLTIDPRLVLRISRDGGFTFGNPIYGTMGKIGQYTTRARWQRLSRGRDLVFQVFCDDPVPVVFIGAFIQTELGTS